MGKIEFPAIVVGFTIHDESGKVVHRGKYRLNDDTERRAAGQRFHEAMRDGFEIRTRRIGGAA